MEGEADYPIGYEKIARKGAAGTPFRFVKMVRDDLLEAYCFYFDIETEDDFHAMIPISFALYEGAEARVVSQFIAHQLERARRRYEWELEHG